MRDDVVLNLKGGLRDIIIRVNGGWDMRHDISIHSMMM